jgi:hypothetical protein
MALSAGRRPVPIAAVPGIPGRLLRPYGVVVGCGSRRMGHRVMAGLVPAIHVIQRTNALTGAQGESFAIGRPRQYETRFRGIMDGRDNPRIKSGDGHDANSA